MADGVRGRRAVGVAAGFPGVAGSGVPLAFHGRARTRCRGWPEDAADLLVEEVVAAVDAVAVDGEQDRDAVPGPGGDLGGVSSGVQPE
jgi:hypothetical protein